MNKDILSLSGLAKLKAPIRYGVVVVVFIISAVVAALGLIYSYSAYPEKFEQLARDEESKLDELERRQRASLLVEHYESSIKEAEKTLGEIKLMLPETVEASNFMAELHRNATENDIYLTRRTPLAMKKHKSGFVEEIPVLIEGCASYHRIGDFVANLSNLQRIITLDEFTMSDPDLLNNRQVSFGNLGVNIRVSNRVNCEQVGGGYPFSATISTYKYVE
ncbi:MAG: type 4a pilus biogenesis protein PilO [Xanthomonadaceae bacterium]|nr:type 4a pilus biogenesis protein PilO [Xanthomonadaceae bacterium]